MLSLPTLLLRSELPVRRDTRFREYSSPAPLSITTRAKKKYKKIAKYRTARNQQKLHSCDLKRLICGREAKVWNIEILVVHVWREQLVPLVLSEAKVDQQGLVS